MNPENLSPDWVITGVAHGAGVRVIASKNLKPGGSIDVVQREDTINPRLPPGTPLNKRYAHDHYRVVVLAEDIVIVDGPDYVETLRMLMSMWQPPEPAQPVRAVLAGADLGRAYLDTVTAPIRLTPSDEEAVAGLLGMAEECPTCGSADRHDRTKHRGIDPNHPKDGVVALLCQDPWHG